MFGDPVTNPKGWETGKLNDAIAYSEYGTSVKSNDEKRGCFVIGMSNITYDGRIDLSVVKHVELSSDEYEKLKLRRDDVIFNRTNSTELVGKTAFWDSGVVAVVASYSIKLRVTQYFDPIWFSRLLNTDYYKKLFMLRCKKAIGQSNISPTLLKEFAMYKPSLEEQQRFSALLEKVELLRAKQRESENELDNLFNSLMQRAFRGELVG
jgi:type I restriction enzyme, S subunit